MADNVNMPREHFDALTESVAGCGKMMEESIERRSLKNLLND